MGQFFGSFVCRSCDNVYRNVNLNLKTVVTNYLPKLFDSSVVCAGSYALIQGTCKGDSGGRLMRS